LNRGPKSLVVLTSVPLIAMTSTISATGKPVPRTAAADSGPNIGYIHHQLLEAQAAGRTLYELNPEPGSVDTLYRALQHALAEVAREIDRLPDHTPSYEPGSRSFAVKQKAP
jgi:hypothetical protein